MRPSLPTFTRRLSAMFMATALLAGSIQTATAADPTHRVDASQLSKAQAQPVQAGGIIHANIDKAAAKDGKVSIIVQLTNASVASYTGGVGGFSATNPDKRGNTRLDLKGTDTVRYRSFLKGKQDAFTKRLDANVKDAKVTGRFDLVLNAVSMIVPADKITAVAKLPGVAAVYPDTLLKLQTDASPAFIGAPTIWSKLGGQESSGQGVIVGVLDTGIWPEHPSYSDPDPSGKPYAAPPPTLSGVRECEFGSATPGDVPFACNNKLIGAERFMATYDAIGPALDPAEFLSARDDDGHGTHTSSTAAGNAGVAASIFGIPRGIVSGIAPRAHVEMFKVCGADGCFGSDSIAGIQAAIADGVNVINFSISGGANPYSDAVELAFLDAFNAGVFVAASAGNSGPGADTTAHRGPWVTTVAASTTSRAFVNTVHVTGSGGGTLNIPGVSLTKGVGPAPIVVNPDEDCSDTAAPGTFTGQIVICKRGNPAGRAADGYNVLQGGAVGMILYNGSAGQTDQETDNHYLPVSHIQFAQGQALIAFLGSHTGEMATISAGVKGTQKGDVMASFSSRGGPGQTLGVSKPDITAPGVQILAGASPQHVGPPAGVALGPQGELFQSIAGTSMSSPHIAGAAALVRDLHPAWSPGQIKSALMTTAKTAGLVKENGVTPFDAFDAGSGRVDLRKAGDPGLTFDATGADFLAWEDELYRVNQPSVYHPNIPGVVTVSRTVRSVLGRRSDWRITVSSPSDFKITVARSIIVNARSTRSFNITMDANRVPLGQTRFATIKLTQTRGGNRVLHIPVTIVRGQAPVTLAKSCAPTILANNQKTTCTITATNPTFENVTYQIKDTLPSRLRLIKSSVVGATPNNNNGIEAHGTLLAAEPPTVDVETCAVPCSPAGYLPLSDFGVPPEVGFGDETIGNYDVPPFMFAGESWETIGFVSNGYAVVGGGTGADVEFINQDLPDSAPPNNVLAPYWTDLNVASGGDLRIAILADTVTGEAWLILDWEDVREFSTPTTASFQIWIGLNGVQDITYNYGAVGSGDGGFLTVGAENKFGNSGDQVYFDGSGAIPVAGTEIVVNSVAGVVQTKVITLKGKNIANGKWRNCATLTSNAFLGISYACARGRNN